MNIAMELIHENNMTVFFTRADYKKAFERYEEICRPVFDELPSDYGELDILAGQSISELMESWNSQRFFRKSSVRTADRLMFATFFSPAARRHSEGAFHFAELLKDKWIAAFPQEPFDSSDYETIMKGFEFTTLLGFKIR